MYQPFKQGLVLEIEDLKHIGKHCRNFFKGKN